MDITYLGHSSFKIKTKTATIVTDPFDPDMVGLKYLGVEGDIVTVSHDHKDHNKAELVKGVKKVISGPGEYEVMDVSIIGIPSYHDDVNGTLRGKNTIYVIEAEELTLVHLGDLGHDLSEKQLEELGDVDVLMIPVGGEYTIGSTDAVKIVQNIEPNFVIPMHYREEGLNPELFNKLAPVETFLTEVGMTHELLPKFTIKKEDITEEQNSKVIVLERK
ncbi:MBL fold metallo-hydrolase [Candidatus Woesebacteria bacterium]|nr:MBL fold metallo-hydrolase [Candidatus Woesebacteria bacterium]